MISIFLYCLYGSIKTLKALLNFLVHIFFSEIEYFMRSNAPEPYIRLNHYFYSAFTNQKIFRNIDTFFYPPAQGLDPSRASRKFSPQQIMEDPKEVLKRLKEESRKKDNFDETDEIELEKIKQKRIEERQRREEQ